MLSMHGHHRPFSLQLLNLQWVSIKRNRFEFVKTKIISRLPLIFHISFLHILQQFWCLQMASSVIFVGHIKTVIYKVRMNSLCLRTWIASSSFFSLEKRGRVRGKRIVHLALVTGNWFVPGGQLCVIWGEIGLSNWEIWRKNGDDGCRPLPTRRIDEGNYRSV